MALTEDPAGTANLGTGPDDAPRLVTDAAFDVPVVIDVPVVPDGPTEAMVYGTDVIEDGNVPLARLLAAGTGPDGRPTPPRIVVYRRPLEARSMDRADLADLVHDVVVEQVANLLGLDPDEVDPSDD